MIDFSMSGSGSVYLLHPDTPEAREHVDSHFDPCDLMHGGCIAVEHRCAQDVACQLLADGFTVQLNGCELELGV